MAGHVGVVKSLAAALLGSKTELLAQPDLELLTLPFKVRRLIVRPIGDQLMRTLNREKSTATSWYTVGCIFYYDSHSDAHLFRLSLAMDV